MRESWYENGQKWTLSFYQDGYLVGERKVWYDNGRLAQWEFYSNGKREGVVKIWDRNGYLWARSYYRNGNLEGEYKGWNENGWPTCSEFYCNNIRVDKRFTQGKKKGFLRTARWFRDHMICSLDVMLIYDLVKIIR